MDILWIVLVAGIIIAFLVVGMLVVYFLEDVFGTRRQEDWYDLDFSDDE